MQAAVTTTTIGEKKMLKFLLLAVNTQQHSIRGFAVPFYAPARQVFVLITTAIRI